MQVALKIKRFNRESGSGPYYEEFKVECDDHEMVLDALIKIREYQDQSLALRCSCRSAICGSCAMRVNGHAGLACNTRIADALARSDTIIVEPAGNATVIKDLVVDAKPFWEKIGKVQPWLSPTGPTPDHEYIVDNSDMLALNQVMGCIMCGACVSDCTVLEVDKRFLGPAALAKALRFAGDPRDGIQTERLQKLGQPGGIWDCTHCFECVQVCPKGVAPMDQILELRHKAVQQGFVNNNGARHAQSLANSVKRSGWLDEKRLIIESYGLKNVGALLALIPTALRSLLANKMPPLIHRKRPGAHKIKRIFEKLESK